MTSRSAWLLMASLVLAPVAGAASAPATLPLATVPLSQSFDLTGHNGEAYRVKVFIPAAPPPPAGYPSIFVLDGNMLFGTFAGAARNQAQSGDIEPAVVVGIESGEGKDGGDRTFDFTATDLTAYEKSIAVDLGTAPRFGGYEAFRQVIETEIKPRVAQMTHLDTKRESLVGWSLGGLFVLHTMFSHPESYRNFVAISPSIWRSDRAVLREIPGFEKQVHAKHLPTGLFMAVGGREEEVTPGMTHWKLNQTGLAKEVKYARMSGNASDLAGVMMPFFAQEGLGFAFHVYDDETHNTVPWAALNPVLRFLLPVH